MTIEGIAEEAFAPAREAVEERRVPGATLGLITASGERAVRIAGAAQWEPEPVPLGRKTWFDLASLTKVIFTTTEILRLVESGRIGLDDPLTALIPDLRQYDANAPERRLTSGQCLSHQTHLPAVEPLYTYGQDPEPCAPSCSSGSGRRGRPSTRTSTSSCSGSRWSARPAGRSTPSRSPPA
jgi:CubicO group peptidase (beta-lactamase class C family)